MKQGLALAMLLMYGAGIAMEHQSAGSSTPAPSVSTQGALEQLFEEDQADRAPVVGKNIDWDRVGTRDKTRERRVKSLIQADGLRSGADYFYAAMILQHASAPDDYLLAHDLCVIAIGKGEERAKWLAAASLDRFLVSIGRSQRFGTQFQSRSSSTAPRLAPVDPGVPDHLRRAFNVPSLDEAKQREAELAEEFERKRHEKE